MRKAHSPWTLTASQSIACHQDDTACHKDDIMAERELCAILEVRIVNKTEAGVLSLDSRTHGMHMVSPDGPGCSHKRLLYAAYGTPSMSSFSGLP